jgi:hypothetical protein
LNNKFAAASQNLEKMVVTCMSQMESKFSKFFGNNIHSSTSNTGKQIGNAGDGISNLQIPKFPPPREPSIENIHSRTFIGNSARVGSFVPPYYASAYSTPLAQTTGIPYGPMPNNAFDSSMQYAYALPNQPPHVPHGSAQPNQTPFQPRAELEGFREEMLEMFRQTFGIDSKAKMRAYQKPYPESYEYVQFSQGFKIPEFTKFAGIDNRTTLEHVGQFVIQCGEVSSSDIYKLRLFPLSLSGAAFTWFISLPPNSIYNWSDLDQKFHDYFFTSETELKLSHLTSVKQNSNETVSGYIRRFKYTRNQYYGLTISHRDLADLAYTGLLDIHKAK